jgi:hypothetical protein
MNLSQKHAFPILYKMNENKANVKHLKLIIIYILYILIIFYYYITLKIMQHKLFHNFLTYSWIYMTFEIITELFNKI